MDKKQAQMYLKDKQVFTLYQTMKLNFSQTTNFKLFQNEGAADDNFKFDKNS